MTPTDITNLSNSIVSKFISSMPSIVSEYNKEMQRQNSGGGSNTKNKNNMLHEDKFIYDRVKRERDLTKILQQELKLRAHELKVIRSVNDMYIKIIKEQGTYNNSMKYASESLAKSVGDSSKTIYGFYQEMDKFASKSSNAFRRLTSIQEESKKLQEDIKNNKGKGQAEIDARKRASLRLRELKALLPALEKEIKETLIHTRISMSKQDPNRKLAVDALQETIKGLSPSTNATKSLDDFITAMSNTALTIKTFNEIVEDSNQIIGNKRKDVSALDVMLREIGKNMEQINHLSQIRGDIFAEDDIKMSNILQEQYEKLQVNLDRWDKVLRKTPERMEEFIEEVSKIAPSLREESGELLSKMTKNKPSIRDEFRTFLEDLKRTLETGKNKEGDKSSLNDAFGDFGKKMIERVPAIAGITSVLKTIKFTADLSVGLIKEIVEDQKAVQKYGVNMQSMLSNFQDSIGTGLSNTSIAEWKYKNRSTNTALGGERSGVEQFRRFMNIPTDYIKGVTNLPQVEMLNYGGKQLSFSQLIGGDSDYQAETYSALTDSLAKMGILPTADAIKKALTESDGIMDVSYKTGMLPKELIDYYGEIADGLYATAQINQVGAEQFMNLTDNFLLLGKSLGANTEATKALNKSILSNAKGDFVDQVTNQVYAQHYAKILGADDSIAKKFGLLAGAKGLEQQKLTTEFIKDPKFRSIIEKHQSAMMNVYSPTKGANAQNILVSEFSKLSPAMSSLFESLYLFITKDARKSTNNPAQANNKSENESLSHFAPSFDKSVKVFDQTTTEALALYNIGVNTVDTTVDTLKVFAGKVIVSQRENLAFKRTSTFDYGYDLYNVDNLLQNPSKLDLFSIKDAPVSKLLARQFTNYAQEFIDSSAKSISNAKTEIANDKTKEMIPYYNEQMLEYQKTVAEKMTAMLIAIDKQEKITDVDKREAREALRNMMTEKGFPIPKTPVTPARGNSNKK